VNLNLEFCLLLIHSDVWVFARGLL
jgi:hypothetical protein